MAQDEGRFGRISDIRRCWAPPPFRPLLGKQIVREYLYVFAAVAPQLGRMTTGIFQKVNTANMRRFLLKVSRDFPNYLIIMQLDQAAWHTAKKLVCPENIVLLAQPACSPELNPAEHIWDDLREKDVANRAFTSLGALTTKLRQGIKRLTSNPSYLQSLTFFPHLNTTL